MRPLILLVCAGPIFAQDADQGFHAADPPQFAALHAAPELESAPTVRFESDAQRAIDRVLIDEGPNQIVARGTNYRAVVDPAGFTFVPAFGAGAPRTYPVTFALESVSVAGTPLPMETPLVVRSGDQAMLDRTSMREVYHLDLGSVEQTFEFDELPARGDLLLDIAVSSDLSAGFVGTDLVFRHSEYGHVSYGEAIAYDATGATTAVVREWSEGRLRLRVPGEFVAGATLPLVVDPPIVGFSNGFGSPDDSAPDICYDERSDLYWVVWEDFVSATDSDCFITSFDSVGNQGTSYSVDNSSDDWRAPRIAYHYGANRLMIVANATLSGSGSGVVQGRIFDVDTSTWDGPAFAVSLLGLPKRWVDIGGNSWDSTVNSHMLVAWSVEASPGNHNPQYRVVDWTGAFITDVLTVDGGGNDDIQTTVSQSMGDVLLDGDFWTMAWTRDQNADGLGQIWARRVVFNGQANQGAGNFQVTSNTNCSWPSVSSRLNQPALVSGDRPSLVAYQRDDPMGSQTQGDIWIATVSDGVLLGAANVSAMEDVHREVNQERPSIATDGRGFLLAYQEQDWSTTLPTFDMYMASGGVADGQLVAYTALSERHQPLATSPILERFGRVTTRWDSATVGTDQGAAIWQVGTSQIAGSTMDQPTFYASPDYAAGAQICGANGHSGSTPLSAEQSSWASMWSNQSLSDQAIVFCTDVPLNQFGYLLASPTPASINMPGGSMGRLCLANAGRFTGNVQSSGNTGSYQTLVNPLAIPQPAGFVSAQPGQAWFFQYWHRDAPGGVPTSNFSNSVGIIFAP